MTARANASRHVVAAKRARLEEPHVAPLVKLADEIAATRGLPRGAVPYPDPMFGGIHTRALVLLEAPGSATEIGKGSGLLSLENDDATAARAFHAYQAAGLEIARCLHWNLVPWPTAGYRTPTGTEQTAARPWLPRLLALLPDLRVVVLLGKVAQQGWGPGIATAPDLVPLVPTLAGPHPSNRGMNVPGAVQRLDAVLRRTAEIVR